VTTRIVYVRSTVEVSSYVSQHTAWSTAFNLCTEGIKSYGIDFFFCIYVLTMTAQFSRADNPGCAQ